MGLHPRSRRLQSDPVAEVDGRSMSNNTFPQSRRNRAQTKDNGTANLEKIGYLFNSLLKDPKARSATPM